MPQSQDLQVTQVTVGAQDVGQHAARAQSLRTTTLACQRPSYGNQNGTLCVRCKLHCIIVNLLIDRTDITALSDWA